MKTLRKKKDDLPQPGPTLADPTPPPPDEPGKKPKFITLAINEDGSFNLDTMRQATLEKLKYGVASTPALSSSSPSATPGPAIAIIPSPVIYGMLGMVESMIAQRMGKIPKEIADSVFTYTPEELALLGPPTDRIIIKYANQWMLRYQDEIALAGLLVTITIKKVNAATMLLRASQGESGPNSKKDEVGPQVVPN